MEKKKNDGRFIISAKHFADRKPTEKSTEKPSLGNSKVAIADNNKVIIEKEEHPKSPTTSEVSEQLVPEISKNESGNTSEKPQNYSQASGASEVASEPSKNSAEELPIEISAKKKKTSALSMKGLKQKKEILEKQRQANEIGEDKPSEDFTETQVQQLWEAYIEKLKTKGGKIMASILATDMPTVDGNSLCIELPNSTMKTEVERHAPKLMGFVKKKLQNYDVELVIEVNEEAEKKYAYSPMEKYEKLKEKNPLIEDLRITFDLDV